MPSLKPNLADIAARAGVSVPTVSKVVNGREDVSAKTRARVQAVLTEHGYKSPTQRRGGQAATTMVDLVITGATSPYSMELLSGILHHAAGAEVEVVISTVDIEELGQPQHEDWARHILRSGRRGVIFISPSATIQRLEAFERRHIPVVAIDPFNEPRPGSVAVGAANWSGGRAAAEHLIGLGHERIAFLGGPAGMECVEARLHGYLAALMSHGIAFRAEYLTNGAFGRNPGREGAQKLLSLPEPPTAIFAANDYLALGALDVAAAQGLSIPRDLSIVGFDGTSTTEQTQPRLTSVAQPLREMGSMALRSLLRMINGDTLESTKIELATELVIRDSTAPPR